MEEFIQLINTIEWKYVLFFVDRIVFAMYFIAVCYLFIFAIGSVSRKNKQYTKAKKQHRYAVIFCVRDGSIAVIDSLKSFDDQTYPRDKFELIVVSNTANSQLTEHLEGGSVKFIHAPADRYNKVNALQSAMDQLDADLYDVAVVMDAESTVEADFLTEINNAYYLGGVAIQAHRVSKKLSTDTALFGAISEEINNSIFRRGHVNIGFSSALIGSGMAFNFAWFKKNISQLSSTDLVKQLEIKLLEQSVFTEYLNDVSVYGQKADNANEFYQKRRTWSLGLIKTATRFSQALLSGNYDYADKLLQWMLPSRTILVGTLAIIAVVLLFLSWGMALKWIALLLVLIVAFSIATPDYFIDPRFIKALRSAPLMFVATALNIVKQKIYRKNRI